MDVQQYQDEVINLFRSKRATIEQWEALGKALLYVSENVCDGPEIDPIDDAVLGRMITCERCDEPHRPRLGCPCGAAMPLTKEAE